MSGETSTVDVDSSVGKYFISLDLSKEFQEKLAQVQEKLSTHFGSSVSRPMKPSKYHLTLGVMEVNNEEFVDFSQKIQELVPRLEQFVKETNPTIGSNRVNKFGSGAVFLEIASSLTLGLLREMVAKVCKDTGAALYDSECFHVTIFRENTIAEAGLPLDLTQLGLAPVSVGAEGTRAFTDVYYSKVKSFQGRAGDKSVSPKVQ